MNNDVPIGALTGALFLILIFSAFFSAAETSMMRINRYRLKHLARQGHRGARLTQALLAHTDRLLGVLLLGNNLLNAAAATLATVIAVRLLGNNELTLTLATLLVTLAILIVAEITPKVVAAARPEALAITFSYVLTPLLKLVWPVVWFVNLFVTGLLRLIRVRQTSTEGSVPLTLAELRTLVTEGGPQIPAQHRNLLMNLLELENVTVADIMVPRSQIETIDIDADPASLAEQLTTSLHTRIPVWEGEPDNIIGLVHVRRLLHHARHDGITAAAVRQAMRPPYFIPEGTPLLAQLQQFQANQRRLGLVVDEYGELLGLIGLEDILEEIVGEFTTPVAAFNAAWLEQEDGSWLVDGGSLLRDLNRKLGFSLPLDGPRTLNGLILEHFEDIPEASVSLMIAGHAMEIVQTQGRRVKSVRIRAPGAGD